MRIDLPEWAFREAKFEDRELLREHYSRGTLQIKWPDRTDLKRWAENHGWPTPWFGFEDAIFGKLLENEFYFTAATRDAGIGIYVLVAEYRLSDEESRELHKLYEARTPQDYPSDWDYLVEVLRGIRRAIEAGIKVEIDGRVLSSTSSFFLWADEHFHALEDGADKWIGNDD